MDNWFDQLRGIARGILDGSSRKDPVCWMFVRSVRENQGLATPAMGSLTSDQDMQGVVKDNVALRQTEAGVWCVALFKIHQFDWHAGMVLPDLIEFIHLRRKSGLEISRLDNQFWQSLCPIFYDNQST